MKPEKDTLFENTFTLHRYYIWANKMRDHLYKDLELTEREKSIVKSVKKAEKGIARNRHFMYMSLWYAMLYVVIEGWQELKLKDKNINNLLAKSKYVELLRRCRNGVFHFQRKYLDERFTDFDKERKGAEWVYKLNLEFGRFFLEKIDGIKSK